MATSFFVSWGLLFAAFLALITSIVYAINQGKSLRQRIYSLEKELTDLKSNLDNSEHSSEEELNEEED